MRLFGSSVRKLHVSLPRRRQTVGRQALGVTALAATVWLASAPTRANEVKWTLDTNGRWNVAANWTDTTDNTNHEPTSSDEVTNDTGATITLDGIGYANDFTSNGNLNLVAGTLYVNHLLDMTDGATLTMNGGSKVLFNDPDATLSGEVLFQTPASDNSSNFLATNSEQTLTIADTAVIHGARGTIGINSRFPGGSLVNNGLISADTVNSSLEVITLNSGAGTPSTFTNNGTLEARNGGTLEVFMPQGGNLSGIIQAIGNNSRVSLNGASPNSDSPRPTINLPDGVIFRASSGGIVDLGGVATFDGGGNSMIVDDGYLTLNGGVTLKDAVLNVTGNGQGLQARLGFLDNVSINGQMIVPGLVYAMNTLHADDLLLTRDPTSSNSDYNGVVAAPSGQTLTLDETTKVHGVSNSFGTTPTRVGGNLVNNGLISADVAGGLLAIRTDNSGSYGSPAIATFTNNGMLEAINGGVLLLETPRGGELGGTIQAIGAGSVVGMRSTYGPDVLNLADGTVFRASDGGQVIMAEGIFILTAFE